GTGFNVGAVSSASARIIDKPSVQIVATDPIAREDNALDTARFTVSRDASQTATAWTISYSVSGTATSGADFIPLPGSVIVPAGEVAATIDIMAIPDTIPEGNETVTVTLLPGAQFTPGVQSSATVVILDSPIDAWRAANFSLAQLADPAVS